MSSARRNRILTGLGKLLAVALILVWSLGPILLLARASLMPCSDNWLSRQPVKMFCLFASLCPWRIIAKSKDGALVMVSLAAWKDCCVWIR